MSDSVSVLAMVTFTAGLAPTVRLSVPAMFRAVLCEAWLPLQVRCSRARAKTSMS